jgi:diacylglycerol kinase family enzyme
VTGERIAEVERALREHADVRTEFTRGPGHATELAAAAASEADAVLVFSGDGTYNEALNGVDASATVGFLPGGGTSVVPRALGLPRDPATAAAVVGAALAGGRTRRISLGTVNGRRFCFSAGIGFDGEAVRRLNERGRGPGGARPGDRAFIATVARMLFEHRGRYEPTLQLVDHGRAAFVVVTNCDPYTYAGDVPLHVTRRASFDLGLDFVAPEQIRPRDLPRLLQAALRGGPYGERVLAGHDVDRLEVRCDRPLPLQADGEDLGDVDHAVFEAVRDAVSVLV